MRRREVLQGATSLAWAGKAAASTICAPKALDAVLAGWDTDDHPDLNGVIVLRHGKVVAERYYNGTTPDSLHDIRSAGKSITSLLAGIAIHEGFIGRVTDAVQQYVPQTKGSAIGDVSLADVLTMRSGLAAHDDDPASPGNEDKLTVAPDPIAFLAGVPRANEPGSTYVYNSLAAYAAGLVVEQSTRRREADFARRKLFMPLGITHFAWATDLAGHTKGQGNLSISIRDLSKVGQMVLGRGQWNGRRIVSAEWIDESLRPRVCISDVDPYADSYGYFWFTKTQMIRGSPVTVHFASGNGGNKIYVVPDRDIVVAIISSAYDHGYGQQRSQAILMAVLKA